MSTSTSNETSSGNTREAAMRRHPSYQAKQHEEPEQGQHDDEVYEEGARRAAQASERERRGGTDLAREAAS
ncbi:hypothetical protein [Leucobacter ruminantium]|uniref:Uncharacterized protein n=1 Tax=Leucobacter ruminantium TaxID=1289170 RepID=A0A939RY79_9MICO|nr:hypothetical protein [Leucobacter ruminantium]MBO1804591.1 hypothetical protein [Leucobacter ruminantium]